MLKRLKRSKEIVRSVDLVFRSPRPKISYNDSNRLDKFFRAAREGNLDDVLKYLNKKNTDINACNASGLTALHLASKGGHGEVVDELLRRGADVNAATERGNTAIHFAAFGGQREIVERLFVYGANINAQSQEKFTPLYMAAQENHVEVVKFLLSKRASQEIASQDGFTPLAVSIQQDHDKVVACLLENESENGKIYLSALHIAAKNDYVDAAKLLANKGHSVNVPSKRGFTPLHVAAHYGNVGVGKLLIEKNADVNYQSDTGIAPLHVGCNQGKSEIVSVLVDNGGDVTSKTQEGLTPLHCAAKSGHEQEVNLLLNTGAPISAKTANGLSPFHMAIQGDHENCASVMLSHNAPVNDKTKDGLNPLHIAAYYGHIKSSKFLLDRKCDMNATTLNGLTPLHIACKLNHIELVKLLLSYGANVNPVCMAGQTPTHVAALLGHVDVLDSLIKGDAETNAATTPLQETPLHLAALMHQTDSIRKLLSTTATKIDIKDKNGKTPFDIASELGNMDDAELLKFKEDDDTPEEINEVETDVSALLQNSRKAARDSFFLPEDQEKEEQSFPLANLPKKPSENLPNLLPESQVEKQKSPPKEIAREISISKADLSLSDVADLLDGDWQRLGRELGMTPKELQDIESEIGKENERGLAMLNNWLEKNKNAVSGNDLERALQKIGRSDVIDKCITDIEEVTDPEDKAIALACLKAVPNFDPSGEYELELVGDGNEWIISQKVPKSGNDNEEETPESPEEEQVPVDEEDVCVENTPQLRASGKFVTNVTSFESDEKMSEGFPEEQEYWGEEESIDEECENIEADVSRDDEQDYSIENTRVLLRRRLHKKTVITGNQEETIVTEDTQIDQMNDIPPEMQKAVLQFTELFLLGEIDFDIAQSL